MSADGPLNMYNAVGVAADRGRRARRARRRQRRHPLRARDHQAHTTDVETFVSAEAGLIGVYLFGDREFVEKAGAAHTRRRIRPRSPRQTLPRVDIIYAHAGMSPDLIDAAVATAPRASSRRRRRRQHDDPALEAVQARDRKGVVVVRSPRRRGIVRRNIEVDDDKTGTVASKELNPRRRASCWSSR